MIGHVEDQAVVRQSLELQVHLKTVRHGDVVPSYIAGYVLLERYQAYELKKKAKYRVTKAKRLLGFQLTRPDSTEH